MATLQALAELAERVRIVEAKLAAIEESKKSQARSKEATAQKRLKIKYGRLVKKHRRGMTDSDDDFPSFEEWMRTRVSKANIR